ncbi:class I SAM-dependent DNA methyltransferase [Halalkalibacter nanhaiisediminis]|uniref:Methyltransferase family protein n=1 Tax=Halalkalibacter nanhaiisediminis TaxID=688079 RepID=A0A562QI02_9BACI|nr:class I SAM-dependent methyltransferase [Halalkalibacter nanhaiisediminis]TWI56374.1 methyltransferase family protein [Halalkalibacter nanhaiisediminis]
MNYQAFAKLYDSLMEEAPYDQWIQFVKACSEKADFTGVSILDIGCGTGELLVRLHQEGANVTGVDLSAEMLAVASKKCEQAGFHPILIEQSMTQLEGLDSFDIVTVFCDSLNYLETEKEVQDTFSSIYQRLKDGGLLLFDVHSIQKIEEGFIGQTFAEDADEIAYIWTSFAGVYPSSVEHELSFFVRDEDDGRYVKVEELHKQRTFPIEQYKEWLIAAGFEIVTITADFTTSLPTEESERIFFYARKKNRGF